jgi:hypothetical protein
MMSLADVFESLRLVLEQAGIRFAIGGSWASTAFGEARFTNDVDILADFTKENLQRFIARLPDTFYLDPDDVLIAIERGRPFNVIHMPTAIKFDLFPAAAFPLGTQELDRAISLPASGLSEEPVPFVTPEDILLAKLHWFRLGAEISETQWRDIQGIVRACGATLDREYLQSSSAKIGVGDLLDRALSH